MLFQSIIVILTKSKLIDELKTNYFKNFFLKKMQELQQRLQRVIDTWGPNGARPSETNCKEDMAEIRKDIVNFHGEMVLLVNYSNINYTGNPFNRRVLLLLLLLLLIITSGS